MASRRRFWNRYNHYYYCYLIILIGPWNQASSQMTLTDIKIEGLSERKETVSYFTGSTSTGRPVFMQPVTNWCSEFSAAGNWRDMSWGWYLSSTKTWVWMAEMRLTRNCTYMHPGRFSFTGGGELTSSPFSLQGIIQKCPVLFTGKHADPGEMSTL